MDQLVGAFLVVAISIAVFLVGRRVTLWYFRINEGLAVLQDTRRTLESINASVAEIAKTLQRPEAPHQSQAVQALREAWTRTGIPEGKL